MYTVDMKKINAFQVFQVKENNNHAGGMDFLNSPHFHSPSLYINKGYQSNLTQNHDICVHTYKIQQKT